MLNTLFIATLVGLPSIEVIQLDGQTQSGRLVSLSADQVVVETASGPQTLVTRELFAIRFPEALSDEDLVPIEHPVWVEFIDGSKVQAMGFSVDAGRATVQLNEGDSLLAATRTLRVVRFFKPTSDLSEQWDNIVSGDEIAGDVLVIRKSRTIEDADGIEQESVGLDSLEGILHEINDQYVAFEFDGTRVEVPRYKVEGIVYSHRGSNRQPDPTSRVSLLDGSAWNMKTCELDGEILKGISVGGVRLSLPLSSVAKIDFSIGNLIFLSDLDPDTFEWKSDLHTPKTPSVVSSWYRIRKDQGFYGGPLLLDGHSYEKGLALHSQTRLSYRLTREFKRFAATAGIDDRYRSEGNVTLSISGDGRQLLSANLSGDTQLNIDLDLRGIRRLEIFVDYGDDRVGYGDYLNLCNARLIK
ncbi:MAG: NPCBM/NEW2 domain-containing protein [Planctomycetaceae bacterium]|nr:NPCBM/NEW2 domain-containing protein [Planctomycetales bacterium]MCB9927724.1 NPCBM/NEW2 domain-containing protein [Planctomycetaceae bacterium]